MKRDLTESKHDTETMDEIKSVSDTEIFMETNLKTWDIVGIVGRGGFSVVYHVRSTHKRNTCQYALKFPNDTRVSDAQRRGIESEWVTMACEELATAKRLAPHPNIVTIYMFGFYRLTEVELPCLVMQYVGHTISYYTNQYQYKDQTADYWLNILTLLLGAANGLEHMHMLGVLHLDVKPDNIGVHERKAVMLDLGSQDPARKPSTVAYRSPDRIKGREPNDKDDVWGLGMVAYSALLIASFRPRKSNNKERHLNNVKSAQTTVWRNLEKLKGFTGLAAFLLDFIKLISSCLSESHDRRPDMHFVVSALTKMISNLEAVMAESPRNFLHQLKLRDIFIEGKGGAVYKPDSESLDTDAGSYPPVEDRPGGVSLSS